MSDDNVKSLPVKFKKPEPLELTVVEKRDKCMHSSMFGAQYLVDATLADVECSLCHERLNPMWVLGRLAIDDRRFHEAHQKYHDEMKRLKERSRTKCEYCGKLTRVSHR